MWSYECWIECVSKLYHYLFITTYSLVGSLKGRILKFVRRGVGQLSVMHRQRHAYFTGVGDCLTSILAESGAINVDAVHFELPISFASDVNICEITLKEKQE